MRSSTLRRSFPSSNRSSSSDNCSRLVGTVGGGVNANAGIRGGGIGFIETDANVLNWSGFAGNGFAENGLFAFDCAFKMFANGFGSANKKKIKSIESWRIRPMQLDCSNPPQHLHVLKMLSALLLLLFWAFALAAVVFAFAAFGWLLLFNWFMPSFWACSVREFGLRRISKRQVGQVCCRWNHDRKQTVWNMWPQGSFFDELTISSRQIMQMLSDCANSSGVASG